MKKTLGLILLLIFLLPANGFCKKPWVVDASTLNVVGTSALGDNVTIAANVTIDVGGNKVENMDDGNATGQGLHFGQITLGRGSDF